MTTNDFFGLEVTNLTYFQCYCVLHEDFKTIINKKEKYQ